jgi:hypothetical protein
MSTLLSPRRPLASLSLNAASSPAKKLDGQKRTPSQKPASAKNKKHGQKETALPKPTLLVFREEKPEVTFSDTIPLDPQPESNTSDGVVELPSELESVLKSLSALVGAPSSALADLADCLTEVPGRQAILSGTAGPCLLAQALRLAAAGGAPPNVGDGLLRLVTRLALEGGERTDEDVGGEVSSPRRSNPRPSWRHSRRPHARVARGGGVPSGKWRQLRRLAIGSGHGGVGVGVLGDSSISRARRGGRLGCVAQGYY